MENEKLNLRLVISEKTDKIMKYNAPIDESIKVHSATLEFTRKTVQNIV